MRSFNVIVERNRSFEPFDVVPFFVNAYKALPKKKRPTNYTDFQAFIIAEAKYLFWGKCEYEFILQDWPCQQISVKWDVYMQIRMNLDIIVDIVKQELKLNYGQS